MIPFVVTGNAPEIPNRELAGTSRLSLSGRSVFQRRSISPEVPVLYPLPGALFVSFSIDGFGFGT